MSTAMRSTLQTVPESLEVTKTNTTQDAPATVSTKTPAKASGEAVATKSSRSYNYHAPSSTNKPITIKNQMMRLLRRSKSTAAAHTDKTTAKTPPGHQPHHHYHHNHVVHPQQNRNGGMVVNMVEGVPLVVGGGISGKSRKFVLQHMFVDNPTCKLWSRFGLTNRDAMSEIIRVNGLSKFGLVHNRISVVNYIPESYVYDEKVGLYVNWKVRDVHMKSRIVKGPFKVKYEENGEMRTKHRYKIIALPEMLCGPSPEIMKFLEDCKYYGTIHSIINMHTPPLEVYEKMEQTAKKIYFERKNENGGDNPTSNNGFTTFKLGEFGEGDRATFLEKIQIAFAEGLAKFFKRSYVNMKKPYEPAVAEDWGPNSPDPWDVDDVDKSMKIIERKSEGLYVSDYWPWFVYDPDVVKPIWKRIYKMLGYKKLKIITVTCDLDVKQYQELKKIREEEVFEIQESIRIFMPDVRSL